MADARGPSVSSTYLCASVLDFASHASSAYLTIRFLSCSGYLGSTESTTPLNRRRKAGLSSGRTCRRGTFTDHETGGRSSKPQPPRSSP